MFDAGFLQPIVEARALIGRNQLIAKAMDEERRGRAGAHEVDRRRVEVRLLDASRRSAHERLERAPRVGHPRGRWVLVSESEIGLTVKRDHAADRWLP